MNDDSQRLIEALRSPAAYGDPTHGIEIIETHISWVILTGEYAYKIKKPVSLGFLDFSTLERRAHFCREEIRLNSRLAPQIYLDVVPIAGTHDAPRVGGTGEPIEFAVRMRQFPQESLLSHLLQRGLLTAAHIDRLAEEIASFHGGAAVAPAESAFGTPERVWQPVEENFHHLSPPEGDGDIAGRIQFLREWSDREFRERTAEFRQRKAGGFIRECHGDMHLGNMLLLDGRIVIFDGIEFNEGLRWIDTQSELAFVVMDLADRGRPEFGYRLLNAYLEQTGDYRGLRVLRYYLVYRALVRAKVAGIRGAQADVAAEERQQLGDEFAGYVRLAESYTKPPAPLLIITHGPSGSGKTHVTQPLLEELGAIRIRSDVERKRLFGLRPLDRSAAASGNDIYTPEATERTYGRLAELAQSILRAGYTAIVDATFLKHEQRQRLRQLAREGGVPFVILDFHAGDDMLRRRVADRATQGDEASEADLAILERQLSARELLTEDERRDAVTIDGHSPGPAVEMAAAVAAKAQLSFDHG